VIWGLRFVIYSSDHMLLGVRDYSFTMLLSVICHVFMSLGMLSVLAIDGRIASPEGGCENSPTPQHMIPLGHFWPNVTITEVNQSRLILRLGLSAIILQT
jgi:hypothetical protein